MAIRTQTQDGMVAVSTGHYAFTIDVQAQRWTFAPADGSSPLLAATSAFPLTPQLATGEIALTSISAEFIGAASDCAPRRLHLAATITGKWKGELCNEIHFLEERVIVNGWYRLSQDHALAHWQVAPCGSRLSADTVQAYLGVHGAIDEMNGTVWSARDVELSTASHNWMYAGAVPRVVVGRGPFSVCLGGTEVAHDFGLELKCRQGIAEYFRFNYGGEQAPQAATAGDEVRSPRLQLLVTQSQHPDQTQAAFTRAMQDDGIVPRKHYRPEDEAWRRPWYCTWADQVGLAAARMAQDQGGGRDYQAIKDVLTQEMVLKAARLIRARDINIGTIIIDDGWQDLRGDWNLDAKKFPDMRGLVDELHRLDFKVALWWAPFIVEKRALIHTRPGFVVGPDPRHGEMLVDYSRKEVREWAEALLDTWFSTGPRGWAVDGIKLDFLAEKTYASTHSAEPGWRGEECLWQQLFALMDRVIRRYTGSPGLLHVPFNPHLAPFCVAVHGEERFDQELGYLTLRPALVDALLPGVWFAPSFNYNPPIVPDFIRGVKRVGAIVQVGKLLSPDVTPDIFEQIRALLAAPDKEQATVGELFRNADGNWEYCAARYRAVVNGKNGGLEHLIVDGKELLAQGEAATGGILYAAGKPFVAALVPMSTYDTVSAWDGNFGMWWHFRPDGIVLEYAVNQAADPTLTFVLNPEVVTAVQGPGPLPHRWLPQHIVIEGSALGEAGVVVHSKLATPIAFQGLNLRALTAWNGRQAPTVAYTLPQGRRVGGEIHIGPALPAAAARADVSFSGPRWHLFPPTGALEFQTGVTVDAAAALNVDVAVVLTDYNSGETLAAPVQPVACAPPRGATQNWSVPWTRPGVFRGSVRVRTPQGTIGVHDFVFLYDLPHWQPELYRPADFWAFWERQLTAMRAQPLNPTLTPLPEKSNAEVQAFAVEITGCNGRRIRGEYSEPVRAGKFPVLLSTPHPGKDLRVGAGEPAVMVYGELDDVAKYRKDVGDLAKSNFLYVYLDYVRWLDFAESRGKADWRRCFAPAGSRGGPMVIAAAALDPRIKLIWMNVGTCNRWDWQVQYTSGWGPYMTDRLPGQSEADFLKVLSYFDPSHFAERVTIPVCASWGLMDGLSPLNGQLSMWVNLRGPKFLELRETGGHDSNTREFSRLQDRVRQAVFNAQPLPDAGTLGLDWEEWVNGNG